MFQADRAADMNAKKKRREMEQASLDATSDLLDTDSNATFAMVRLILVQTWISGLQN